MCLFLLICLSGLLRGSFCLENGVGLTPALGFNSWDAFGCTTEMSEENIHQIAQALVDSGMRDLGWDYLQLDDCYIVDREKDGTLVPDPKTFPSGMKAMGDFLHSLKLKFGVYTDRGQLTCDGRPGAKGHESGDAMQYASWGVDYVVSDSCNATQDHQEAFDEYAVMRDALNATGRPIYYALCGWADWYAPVGSTLANSWRTGPDNTGGWANVMQNLEIVNGLSQYGGPGGWNDPCVLIGKTTVQDWAHYPGGLIITELQSRTQLNLWSIVASPMLISADIRKLSDYALQTYSNAEVLAVNQDPLGRPGYRFSSQNNDTLSVWGRPLYDGTWALAFLNNDSPDAHDIACEGQCWKEMGWSQDDKVDVRDLWLHKTVATVNNGFTSPNIPGDGGSNIYRLSKSA